MPTEVTIVGRVLEKMEARDAIHIAVAPVIAAERLYPGQHIGLAAVDDPCLVSVRARTHIGIVDPFLTHYIDVGTRFWMFLYPHTITSLTHQWTHPAFEKADGTSVAPTDYARAEVEAKSRAWIEKYVEPFSFSYDELMSAADEWVSSGYYLNMGEELDGEYLPEEFWVHYDIVTGTVTPESKRNNFFSCSC